MLCCVVLLLLLHLLHITLLLRLRPLLQLPRSFLILPQTTTAATTSAATAAATTKTVKTTVTTTITTTTVTTTTTTTTITITTTTNTTTTTTTTTMTMIRSLRWEALIRPSPFSEPLQPSDGNQLSCGRLRMRGEGAEAATTH